MADSQVKTANICNITSSTVLRPNAGGSGTYIADNSVSVHMTSDSPASGIYVFSLPEQSVIGDKYTISFVPVCATNNVMLVVLHGVTTQISFTSGNRYTLTITATATDKIVAFYGGDSVEKTVIIKDIQIEKGETATPYRPYSATGWQHSLRELKTATETIQSGDTIYADGTAATVSLKGNTTQSGTPSPSNPVEVNGVGVRTENLASNLLINDTSAQYATILMFDADLKADTTYTLSFTSSADIRMYMSEAIFTQATYLRTVEGVNTVTVTTKADLVKTSSNYQNGRWLVAKNTVEQSVNIDITNVMFNTGSTAKPYEPYGYKIPISSANTTTPVYLGQVQTTRKIKKLGFDGSEGWLMHPTISNLFYIDGYDDGYYNNAERGFAMSNAFIQCDYNSVGILSNGQFVYGIPSGGSGKRLLMKNTAYSTVEDWKTWLAQQYAAGTPVTVWYVLATPTTGIVNEPLRKIGDYADTVSGITIPTITGKDTFDVLTTLKPSEVELTYTGWHDASVKEWDGTDWQ